MQNECIPFYEPGADLTATVKTGTTVLGKRFVKIGANRPAGPGLNTDTTGANIVVEPAAAGNAAVGVAKYDAAADKKVGVHSITSGKVVPVTADGAIAAGAEVEVSTAGKAKTTDGGKVVGMCLTGAADAADAMILLYPSLHPAA